MEQIKVGDRVCDRMTGFSGIAIAVTEWLYNCRRITVQPSELDKDGAVAKTETFDEDQLRIVQKGAFTPRVTTNQETATEKTGGPRDTPSRQNIPGRR